MIRRFWKIAVDWGLLGNIVWAAITLCLGALLPIVADSVPVLLEPVNVQVPTYALISVPLVIVATIFLVIRLFDNPSRAYAKLNGYYRRDNRIDYFPYHSLHGGVAIAKIVRTMEFVVVRDGLTVIGPYFYYGYVPRGQNGSDEIVRPTASCSLNDRQTEVNCDIELSPSGPGSRVNDKLRIALHPRAPLRRGDVLKLRLEYEIVGQHAIFHEELEAFFGRADLKPNYRVNMQKKHDAEMVYGFVRASARCHISVHFPEHYPWRYLDTFDDVLVMSTGTRPLDKATVRKFAKIRPTNTAIHVDFPRGVGADHGFYVFWHVPTKAEAVRSGFAGTPITAVGLTA